MHPSYFLISDPGDQHPLSEATLSAEVSEWLFYIKFWDQVSSTYGKDFAQYEEEVIPTNLADDIANALLKLRTGLVGGAGHLVSFRYGWTHSKEALMCQVTTEMIVEELGKLIGLLGLAVRCHCDVYCQL